MTSSTSMDYAAAAKGFASVLNGRLERVRQLSLLSEKETISKLYAVGAKMASRTKIASFVDLIADHMAKVLCVEKATVWFVDEESDQLWTAPKKATVWFVDEESDQLWTAP